MNRLLKIIILLLCFSYSNILSCFAQSKSKSNQPPWVVGNPSSWAVGEYPRIDLQGNTLRVEFKRARTPEDAEVLAEESIAAYFTKRYGLEFNSTGLYNRKTTSHSSIARGRKKEYIDRNKRHERTIKFNGKVYGRFMLLDKYVEYSGGSWYFAGLYLVADQGMSLANIPPITYGVDRGAWRSCILPGWAQLYTGRTMAGITFMGVEAGLIGSAIYLNGLKSYNTQRMNEAYGISTKLAFKKKADKYTLYRNIALGTALAWYAYNIIDAFTSKSGKLYYTTAYGQYEFSLAPVAIPEIQEYAMGVSCRINF